MGSEEKTDRWKELYKSIETNSAQHFASNIITRLSKVHNSPGRRFSIQMPRLDANILNEACQESKKRL
jgi:trehalose-6-phosphate synthase